MAILVGTSKLVLPTKSRSLVSAVLLQPGQKFSPIDDNDGVAPFTWTATSGVTAALGHTSNEIEGWRSVDITDEHGDSTFWTFHESWLVQVHN